MVEVALGGIIAVGNNSRQNGTNGATKIIESD